MGLATVFGVPRANALHAHTDERFAAASMIPVPMGDCAVASRSVAGGRVGGQASGQAQRRLHETLPACRRAGSLHRVDEASCLGHLDHLRWQARFERKDDQPGSLGVTHTIVGRDTQAE